MRKNVLIVLVSLLIFCRPVNAELVVNDDGTVTDTETGLMWQQDEVGAMNWESALAYCENLELAGYDDWRLPNINELQTLVDYSTNGPAIDTHAFPNSPNALFSDYWSSTTYSSYSDYAWLVYFGGGYVDSDVKSFTCYVRAVRSGQ